MKVPQSGKVPRSGKISRRAAWVILGLGVLLLLGVVFRSFVMENFVTPLSLAFWMVWRVAISIDQAFYWGMLIMVTVVYLLARTTRRGEVYEPVPPESAYALAEELRYWRTAIMLNAEASAGSPNLIRSSLGNMMATAFTLKMPGSKYVEIYECLKQKQITLPDNIYNFLFAGEKSRRRRSLAEFLSDLRQTPARWLRHWRGRDQSDYYQTITDVIAYLENLMEVDHDDTHPGSPADH